MKVSAIGSNSAASANAAMLKAMDTVMNADRRQLAFTAKMKSTRAGAQVSSRSTSSMINILA